MSATQHLLATLLLCAAGAHGQAPQQWSVSQGGNNHWYLAVVQSDSISWQDAEAAAENLGGYLATITSPAEDAFVFNLLSDAAFWQPSPMSGGWSTGPWLGGYQLPGSVEPDQGWVWVTGEPWSYSNWSQNPISVEPNNAFPHEDYLQYHFFTTTRASGTTCLTNYGTYTPRTYVIESLTPIIPEPASIWLLAWCGFF